MEINKLDEDMLCHGFWELIDRDGGIWSKGLFIHGKPEGKFESMCRGRPKRINNLTNFINGECEGEKVQFFYD